MQEIQEIQERGERRFARRLVCRALVARSVAVEGLALRACTLRGRGRFGASRLHAPWPWKVWRFAPARSVAVEGLALRACTLCSPGRVSAPCAQALAPFRVFVERGVLRGGEAAPPISESANQPISRALRWSARVFVEKGAALPTAVRNRKFMQSHMLSCRGLCYSMDVSMSVSCSSSFLLSLHTEAPRRFARGLFLGRERKLRFFVKESGWEEEDGANMVECMHEKG